MAEIKTTAQIKQEKLEADTEKNEEEQQAYFDLISDKIEQLYEELNIGAEPVKNYEHKIFQFKNYFLIGPSKYSKLAHEFLIKDNGLSISMEKWIDNKTSEYECYRVSLI